MYSDGSQETINSMGYGESGQFLSLADIDDDGDGVATIQLSTYGMSLR